MLSLKSRKCYNSGSKNLFSLNISGNFLLQIELVCIVFIANKMANIQKIWLFKGVLQISLKIKDN